MSYPNLISRDAEINALKAQIALLREAILAVETVTDDVDWPYCPWCQSQAIWGENHDKITTHAPDCLRQRALEEMECSM